MGQSPDPPRQLPILTILRKMRQENLPHPLDGTARLDARNAGSSSAARKFS
jgi:hypothetical protein